jgi:hypothetical protein
MSPRLALCCLVAVAVVAFAPLGAAEEVTVPVARQAELIVRVAAYDRNLPARAGGTVRVLIVMNPEDADSRVVASQMDAALHKFDKIAGLPYEVTTIPLPSSAADVAATCRQNHVSIVYVTQGLDARMGELAAALGGVDVFSIAALVRYVPQGIVLGFDLVSAKPTLVINLPQANKQNVSVEAGVLHLMKVIQ